MKMNKEQITQLQGYGCIATNYKELIDWVEKEHDIKINIDFDGEIYIWKVEGDEEYGVIYDILEKHEICYYSKELCEKDIAVYLLHFLKIKNISTTLNLTFKEIKLLNRGIIAEYLFNKEEWEICSKHDKWCSDFLPEMETLKQKGVILENEKKILYYRRS